VRRDALTSVIAIVVFTVLLGLVYPLAVTGISQLIFNHQANGSLAKVGGKVVGSSLIGQNFGDQVIKGGKPQMDKNGNPVTNPDPKYFQTRPSATTPADNAASSAFSNLGPNNVATKQAITSNIKSYLQMEKQYVPTLTPASIPVDAANSSASGIDPDISEANARLQAHRVAAVRNLPLARVDQLISDHTVGRSLGFFGEPGVDVLDLNLALDHLVPGH